MAARLRKKASNKPAVGRHYTYAVTVSFETQYSFTEDEVQQSKQGGKDDVEPTYGALAIIENDIREQLLREQFLYPIYNLDARTDFHHLLGVDGQPAIGAPASACWKLTCWGAMGRLQYIYGPELFEQRRYRGISISAKVKKGKSGKRNSKLR